VHRLTAPLLVAALATTACGTGSASGRKTTVLAAAYPFAWAAQQVAGPDAKIVNLVKPGAEPHDIELSPRQIGAFQDARVVVYLRGFQAAVDRATAEAPKSALLDLTSVVDVQPPDSGLTEATSTGADPHVWLDPVRMRAIVDAIASKLAARDAERATNYRRRAAATDERLTQLDAALRQGLAHCTSTDIVTSHTAFGYLARRYGLHQVGIAGLSPDTDPAPSRIAAIADYAKRT